MDISNNYINYNEQNQILRNQLMSLLFGPPFPNSEINADNDESDIEEDISNNSIPNHVDPLDTEYMRFFRNYFYTTNRSRRMPSSGGIGGLNTIESILQRSMYDPSQNIYKKVLSKEGENSVKKVIYKKDTFPNDSCPVTLTDFKEGDEVSQLPCGHIFVPEAVIKWLKDEKATCPVCRKPLASKEVKKEFTKPAVYPSSNTRIPTTNRRLNGREILTTFINNQIQREEEAELQAAIIASLRDQTN